MLQIETTMMGDVFTLAQSRNQLCWGALPIPGHIAAKTSCVLNQHLDFKKANQNVFDQDKSCTQKCYVPFLKWQKYRLCSLMDQVLSKAGLLCAEESTPSVVSSCHSTRTYTHTPIHTNTLAYTSTQTLKLGTISIVTQHYRFDYLE